MNIGDLFFIFRGDDRQLVVDAQRAGDRAGGVLGGKLGQNVNRGLTAAGFAVGTFVAAGIEQFGRFQEKMNEVFTLLPDITDEAMAEMTADVKAFSRETGRTTDEVVPALYQAISAGVPRENVFEFLRTANKAATAGVASVEDSVNLLSAVTKGYGDTSQENVQKVADLAFQTVKLGQTTYPELAASIGSVVPLAAALGVKQEELFGITATLTGVTGNTADVMTQQQAVMTALVKQTPEMTAAVQKLGYATAKQLIETEGLTGGLAALAGTTNGTTEELTELFGRKEAITGVLALTGAQAEIAAEKIALMDEATGSVDVAFDRMESGIAASGRKIAAHIQTLAIDVGDKLQAIGPVLLALNQGGQLFGVSPARLFAGLTGAAVGRILIPAGRTIVGLIGRGIAASGAIASALGRALDAIPGSATIKRSLSVIGGKLGGKLGLAMGIAAAAAFAFWFANEMDKQRADIEGQLNQIGADVTKQIATGTDAQLQVSLAAIKAAIDKIVADTKDNILGISLARPQDLQALEGLVAQYNVIQTELNRRAAISAGLAEAALRAAEPGVQQAAAALADTLPTALEKREALIRGAANRWANLPIGERLVALGHEARLRGAQTSLALAGGLRERRSAVTSAMDQLRADLKNAMSPKRLAAKDIGLLFGKDLRKGLNSADPIVKAQAQATRALIEDELIETIKAGGKAGEKIQDELEAKLKSKDPKVRRQAERTKSIIDAALKAETAPKSPGDAIGDQLNADLKDQGTPLGRTAYGLGRLIYRNLLAGVKGTGPIVPQTTTGGAFGSGPGGPIPVYQSGISYVPYDQLAFLHRGESVLTPTEAAAYRGEAGPSISVGDIHVDARGATDPWAVGQAVMDAVAGGLRAEMDRLPVGTRA